MATESSLLEAKVDRRILNVILLTNMITPYRIPLFRAIGEHHGIKLTIVAETESEGDRQWKALPKNLDLRFVILPGKHVRLSQAELHFNPGVFSTLQRMAPDVVVIGGFSSITAWMTLLWARIHGLPVVLWSGSTLLSSQHLRGPVTWLRKLFVRSANTYVSYGNKASAALIWHGGSPDRIVTGCNVGDVDFYRHAVSRYRQKMITQLEPKATKPQLLYVGQLIPRKGVLQLLGALRELNKFDWSLTVVGDGPLLAELENYACRHLAGRVEFKGFYQPEALVPYFGSCDILAIPSLVEVGSIVMSEGIASGLFILASVYDGSTHNLIQEPINGVVVDPKQHQDLVSKLRWLLVESPWQGRREGIADSIKDFTPEYYADAFIRAIYKASGRRDPDA